MHVVEVCRGCMSWRCVVKCVVEVRRGCMPWMHVVDACRLLGRVTSGVVRRKPLLVGLGCDLSNLAPFVSALHHSDEFFVSVFLLWVVIRGRPRFATATAPPTPTFIESVKRISLTPVFFLHLVAVILSDIFLHLLVFILSDIFLLLGVFVRSAIFVRLVVVFACFGFFVGLSRTFTPCAQSFADSSSVRFMSWWMYVV